MMVNIIYNTGENVRFLTKSKDELELFFLDYLKNNKKDEEYYTRNKDIKIMLNKFLSEYIKIEIDNKDMYILKCVLLETEDRWIENIKLCETYKKMKIKHKN